LDLSFRAQREFHAGGELLLRLSADQLEQQSDVCRVTNDLRRRIYEHQNKLLKGFTQKYNVNKLVYYEQTSDVFGALTREKEIKKWRREKKNALVVQANPKWTDLSKAS
jgi:putative endonuclease